MDCCWTPSR